MDFDSESDIVQKFLNICNEATRSEAVYYLEVMNQDLEKSVDLYYQDHFSKVSQLANPAQNSMKILQWNIQGLLSNCLFERTDAVIKDIKRISPDVVMLQEIVLETFVQIQNSCSEYKLFSSYSWLPASYFTLLMVRKETFQVDSHEVVRLPMTMQGRALTTVSGLLGGKKVTVMTSHLESTAQEASTRMQQLVQVWKTMDEQDPLSTVVFAGDTNLRDREVTRMHQRKPEIAGKVEDVWEKLGSPNELRYSWDCSKNDNQLKDSQAKLRFGRFYIRRETQSSAAHFHPVSMEFIGTERLPCGSFASDHWGILVKLETE